jgi:hypothetical protein
MQRVRKVGIVMLAIDGLKNATAVTVDEKGAIDIAEVTGVNVRKQVKAK